MKTCLRLLPYAQAIEAGRRPVAEQTPVSPAEYAEDTMMLGLRLAEGISSDTFVSRHGVPISDLFGAQVKQLQDKGLLHWEHNRLCLTETAWPLGNLVFSEFVGVLEEN